MGAFKNIVEPGAIVAIFTIGSWVNRRKSIAHDEDHREPLLREEPPEEPESGLYATGQRSLRNRRYLHSRILAKFPFLLEIWYWLLTYWIYQGSRAISARAIAGHKAIFQNAEHHALQILSFESYLHMDIELSVQRLVLDRYPSLMDILAKIYYSHIVLGVAFLVYCYTFLPRGRYQSIRRTLALENAIAFTIISLWRCMPPRLLPEEYGFIDVLHHGHTGSAWTQNKFQLTIAAMPSLHFVLWPIMMGLTVVATANHFILDGIVGTAVIATAFYFNRAMLVLLPIERGLFRLLRLEKPRD